MTSTSVAIVDYGMGNLRSVAQAVLHAAQGLPVSVAVTSQPQAVRDAARVILPGQGAMGDCMAALRASGLQEAVLQAAGALSYWALRHPMPRPDFHHFAGRLLRLPPP